MSTQVSLSSYTTLKLRLGSVLQNLLAFAQAQKNEDRSSFIQSLLADLADDTFRLAVFGKYNRGKSSLINALLGMDRLPTGILPLTSVITTVRYDSQERVLIQREGWSVPQEISLEQLPEYVTENGNPGNEKQVTVAQIFLPADILRYGFFLVDTPGIGSSILANTMTAESFISRADAVIVVMSVESPLNEEELGLLERVQRQIGKVFVVLNKADLVSDDEKRQITEAFATRVGALIQDELPIFVLSARNAIRFAEHPSDDARERGIEELVRALLAFMANQKTGQFLRRMGERASDIIQQEQLSHLFLQKVQNRQSLIRNFNEFVDSALAEGIEAVQRVKAERDAVEIALQPYIAEWRASVIQSIEDGRPQRAPLDLIQYLKERSALRPESANPAYEAVLTKLDDLIQSVQRREAELTGGNYSAAEKEAGPLHKFQAANLTPGNPGHSFSPPRSVLNWIPGAARTALSRALDAYCREVLNQVQLAFDARLARLTEAFGEQLRRARERVARILNQQSDPHRLSALKQLSEELGEIMREIALVQDSSKNPAGVDERRAPDARRPEKKASRAKCILCEHLTGVAFQFMREYLYRLLTDPAERNRNAERGGMCPFHTWMYESISSPQGICAGYAPVLLHIADRLDGLANTVPEVPGKIERVLRNLANRSDRCIACQVIDAAYKEKLGEIVASPERLEAGTLCLPHLASALLHDRKAPDSLKATADLASRLRRMGEDMQQFALKQSGLRYGWASSAEKTSYANGLMMVASARPLSYIKQVVEIGTG